MSKVIMTRFTVPFVAGLQRPRMTGGKFPRQYDTSVNRMNKAHIQSAYRDACREQHGAQVCAQKGVPVVMVIEVFKPLPIHAPKATTAAPFVIKPDADNIAKLVLDALNGLAYADDKQVVRLTTIKHERVRGIESQTHITVTYWSEDEA